MSERQTVIRTDSTNNHTNSNSNSQMDMCFGDPHSNEMEIKTFSLFRSPNRSPQIPPPASQTQAVSPIQATNIYSTQTPIPNRSCNPLGLRGALINKITNRTPFSFAKQGTVTQMGALLFSQPTQTQTQENKNQQSFAHGTQDRVMMSEDGSKTPKILNSPRVKFPDDKNLSKTVEKKILQPVVNSLPLSSIIGVKRSYDQFSQDKQVSQSRLSSGLGPQISSVCQRNLFGTPVSLSKTPIFPQYEQNDKEESCQSLQLFENLENEHIQTPAFKRLKLDQEMSNVSQKSNSSPSIYQRFLKKDQAFQGKFSNGTTPKHEKPLAIKVPPEFEMSSQQSFNTSQGSRGFITNSASPVKSLFSRPPLPSVGSYFEPLSTFKQADQSYNMNNPFKIIAQQTLSRRTSEILSDHDKSEKQPPDTPMIEYKHFSFVNDSQRASVLTSSDCTNREASRFLKDFVQKGTLGKGQFGKVIRCQNKLDQIEYAVKITAKKVRAFEKSGCLQEVFALSALSVGFENQHIVRYYNGWIEDQYLYIQMELCKESLRSHSAKKRREDGSYNLSEQELRSIMRDVCLGLQELHNRGIVHMDIKPENILESFSGKFKIGDLGMSRLLTSIAEDHEIPEGDCRYMAKEVLIDDPSVPIPDLTKADIFALGIVLFELVEGVTLSKNGPQWQDLRDQRVVFSERSVKAYSQDLLQKIKQMLHPQPDQRPSPLQLLQTFLQSPQEIELERYKRENQQLQQKLYKIEEYLKRQGVDLNTILEDNTSDQNRFQMMSLE